MVGEDIDLRVCTTEPAEGPRTESGQVVSGCIYVVVEDNHRVRLVGETGGQVAYVAVTFTCCGRKRRLPLIVWRVIFFARGNRE